MATHYGVEIMGLTMAMGEQAYRNWNKSDFTGPTEFQASICKHTLLILHNKVPEVNNNYLWHGQLCY